VAGSTWSGRQRRHSLAARTCIIVGQAAVETLRAALDLMRGARPASSPSQHARKLDDTCRVAKPVMQHGIDVAEYAVEREARRGSGRMAYIDPQCSRRNLRGPYTSFERQFSCTDLKSLTIAS